MIKSESQPIKYLNPFGKKYLIHPHCRKYSQCMRNRLLDIFHVRFLQVII